MDEIPGSLAPGARGLAVANLQDALRQCLESGGLLAVDAAIQRALAQDLEREREEQTYGEATARLVGLFQRERNMLRASGEVDAATAAALNALLAQLGMLEAPPAQPGRAAPRPRLAGVVATAHGAAAENLALKLVRREFGGKASTVASTTTGSGGSFAFQVEPAQARGLLEVVAMAGDKEVTVSRPLRGLADGAPELQLRLPADALAEEPEYTRLAADLQPLLENIGRLADARESPRQRDISVLASATGWDARVLAVASAGQRLARDSGLKPELAYALVRAGLPSDRLTFAQLKPETIGRALRKARSSGIVSAKEASDSAIAKAQETFTRFAREQRLAAPMPGSSATLAEMVAAAPVSAQVQQRFAEALLDDAAGPGLWERAKARGIAAGDIEKLKLQGQLAFLAGHSLPVTRRLVELGAKTPADLVERKLHQPQAWTELVLDLAGVPPAQRAAPTEAQKKAVAALLPASFAQETVEERLAAYSASRARKLRQSYPTQVMAHELEHDPKFALRQAHAETVNLLKKVSGIGFRLGETPVAAFVRKHAGELGNTGTASFEAAANQLKALQRMYQITPSDEALAVLMALDITSAYDVMAFTAEAFEQMFRDKYLELHDLPAPGTTASEVRHRAGQVTSVTYNLFAVARKMGNEPAVAGLTPPPAEQQAVRDSLIRNYPTLESLFGATDFCECEHCRSVLSPAAYLVDLLQFVDIEPTVWGNFLAQWKARHAQQDYPHQVGGAPATPYMVLRERRPDLARIPLTCENTHTALPYIDLVNEILEYYVAHDGLAPQAAGDTGSAASADLVAEPQNVIAGAYGRLRTARYPLPLPFDMWAESARRHAGHFDVTLAQLMEAFRRDDVLFDAGLPHDRAGVFLEQLQVAPAEAELFADPTPLDAGKWQVLYGFAANAANVATTLASAKTLARRLGVSYRQLVELVQTGFVNPQLPQLVLLEKLHLRVDDARLFAAHRALLAQNENTLSAQQRALLPELRAMRDRLQGLADGSGVQRPVLEQALVDLPFGRVLLLQDPDTGCDLERTTLKYADGTAADAAVFQRLNLFVRLWRKLGWSIAETDRALATFVPAGAPYDTAHYGQKPLLSALIGIAHLKTLVETLKLGARARSELTCLWAPIGTTGPKSLYAQLFLHPSVLASAPVFDHPLGNYLADAAIQLRAHLPALQGALGLTAAEVELVLAQSGRTLDDALSLANVSLLYRHALLARALGLPVRELLVLRDLSGLDPFAAPSAQPLAQLADDLPFTQTLEFVRLAQEVQGSGFGVDQLDELLRHRFDAGGPLAPDAQAQRALLRTLVQGIRAIQAEHAVPADPAALADEQLRQKLGLLLAPEVADTFMAMLAGTASFPPGQSAQGFFDQHLLKSPAGAVPATGFLDAADFALLFTPPPANETEVQARARVGAQRTRLAQTFLPHLQEQLVRRSVTQALAAATAADATLVEGLATQPALLADPQTVLQRLVAAAAGGPTESTPAAGARQLEAWFEVPTSGTWRFQVALDKAGASAVLRLPHLANPVLVEGTAAADGELLGTQPQQVVELQAGELYRLSLSAQGLGAGSVRLLVQGPQLPAGPLARLVLYPAALDAAAAAVLRLQKAARLLRTLGLGAREARWLLTHPARFGNPQLGELPVQRVGDTPAERTAARQRMGWWRRLARYARLQREMAGGTDALVDVFEAQDLPAADRLATAVYPRIAAVTRREPALVQATAEALVRTGSTPAFDSELPLARLWDALQLLERLGVAPASAVAWCGILRAGTDSQREAIARDVRAAIKARFDTEGWRRVAQAINDPLRQRRRDALVAYLLHHLGYERLEQLYEHFLIDPGMEPVVQTSRIRLAISSVQLFVQRCLLNLEPKVHPSTLVAGQWEWMKRYRVWEANRKIFLFPENWLEPEFRDDKTHLFKELEGTLLQDDASADMVEDAFLAYLRKLDELARLDVVAMHVQDHFDPSRRVLHVIARTFGQPCKYFYRRLANRAWSAWEPVDLPIEGNHVVPVWWRERLCLFWVSFLEKAADRPSPTTGGDTAVSAMTVQGTVSLFNSMLATKIVEAQLHWSERVQGEWTEHASGGHVIRKTDVPATATTDSVPVHVEVLYEPDGTEAGVQVHLGDFLGEAFHLAGRNALPERGQYRQAPLAPYTGSAANGRIATRQSGRGALRVHYNQLIVTKDNEPPTVTDATPDILGQGGAFTVLSPNNELVLGTSPEVFADALNPQRVAAAVANGLAEIKTLMKPVFYADNRHTFFVEPDVTEITVDEVDEWTVTTTTGGGHPEWELDEWWEHLVLIPAIPQFEWPFGPDPAPERDWLINPRTVLAFDESLLGRDGQLGLALRDPREQAGAERGEEVLVEVNAASVVRHGARVVVQDAHAVTDAGATLDLRAGLKVVGAGGLGAAMGMERFDMRFGA